jgi:glycosyltransferase involved in cell wall biosynthesis
MPNKKISFMIPAYNEEAAVGETVHELVAEFKKLNEDFEIIVFDHGSSDNTYHEIRKLQDIYPNYVKSIHFPHNIEYGGIINLGLKKFTSGDIIGWTCADGEIKAEDTRKVAEFLLKNPEFHASKASRINRNVGVRKFISYWYNQFAESLFRIKSSDVNGWPFFIRSDAYETLDLKLQDWVINIEILHKLRRNNLAFKEIDCEHQQRKGGRSSVRFYTILEFTKQLLGYRASTLSKRKK